SSSFGSMARRSLSAQAGSRKCWPNFFLARVFTVTVVVVVLAAPVLLFDLLDLVFAEAEVVADLVNQRLADAHDKILFVVCLAFVRTLKDQHAIGKHVAVARAALGQRCALIESEQRVRRLDLHLLEEVWGRLVLDNDGDVLHGVAELPRNGRKRFGNVALEDSACHRGRRPALFAVRRGAPLPAPTRAFAPGRVAAAFFGAFLSRAREMTRRKESQSSGATHRSRRG